MVSETLRSEPSQVKAMYLADVLLLLAGKRQRANETTAVNLRSLEFPESAGYFGDAFSELGIDPAEELFGLIEGEVGAELELA